MYTVLCLDEAVDEDESLPGKDIPSLFGALGLVKKAPMRSYGSQASSKGKPHMIPTAIVIRWFVPLQLIISI